MDYNVYKVGEVYKYGGLDCILIYMVIKVKQDQIHFKTLYRSEGFIELTNPRFNIGSDMYKHSILMPDFKLGQLLYA